VQSSCELIDLAWVADVERWAVVVARCLVHDRNRAPADLTELLTKVKATRDGQYGPTSGADVTASAERP
jgi:hypothetical protein